MRITKDLGPESGFLTFSGVRFVHVSARFTIAGIACGGLERLAPESLESLGLDERSLGPGELVFVLHESWRATYRIVAESVAYEVDG